MRQIQRMLLSLLLVCSLVIPTALPVFAQEGQAKEEPEILEGKLQVYTRGQGIHKVKAVLYDKKRILVSPQTAASLTDSELIKMGEGQFEFRRDNYAVRVDANTDQAFLGLYVGESSSIALYPGENFALQKSLLLESDKKKTWMLPLEQLLYLMNVQWLCQGECVYLYSPPETLWNVVGDCQEMYRNLPSSAEILGESAGKKWGNAFKYGWLAFSDELSPSYLFPFLGDDYWAREKMEEALLTLAVPCSNVTGSLKKKVEKNSSQYLSDLGGLASEIGAYGGSVVAVADKLTKVITAWSEVELPESFSKTFTGIGFAGKMAAAISAAGRYEFWGDNYLSQLDYLSKIQNSSYSDYCKDLNQVAGSLRGEYGNYVENIGKEGGKTMAAAGIDALLGLTPAGLVFSSYEITHSFVKTAIPAAKDAYAAGDNASAAMRLCDLSVLMEAEYGKEIVRVVEKGALDSAKDLEQLRLVGSLMMGAAVHSQDSLYSAWKNMYMAKHPDAGKEEIQKNAGDTISMDELANKLVESQTGLIRFEETSQYDSSLLLYGDMKNLYSETAGAYREEIPPEYVKPYGAENNGGNVVGYQGKTYYWKYNGNSFYSPGVFAYYSPVNETSNELICRNEDGSEQVLLTARGGGPIFVSGERIYLRENGVNLYSVKLDGSDRVDHGIFEPWAADEEKGTLIGRSGGGNGSQVAILREDHTMTTVAERGDTFLRCIDGQCYFSVMEYQEVSGVDLYRISLDGSGLVKLDSVASPANEAFGLNIFELIQLGEKLYYSYGYYAGTGGFFQNGGINCVNTDGSNAMTCVEYGNMKAEEFVVEDRDGETFLYYIGDGDVNGSYIGFWDDYPYSSCLEKKLSTGEVTGSSFRLSRPGAFLCMDGEIVQADMNQAGHQLMIPKEAGFGFKDRPEGNEEELALIQQMDLVGEQLYFTVEWSRKNGQDMGWRPGYDRQRSVFYTMELGEKEAIELYSY